MCVVYCMFQLAKTHMPKPVNIKLFVLTHSAAKLKGCFFYHKLQHLIGGVSALPLGSGLGLVRWSLQDQLILLKRHKKETRSAQDRDSPSTEGTNVNTPAGCSRDRWRLQQTPGPLWLSWPCRNLDPEQNRRVRSLKRLHRTVSVSARPHRDNDDAGLRDDVLQELVEGGVRVVVEALQLLHHVVQVEKRPQGLDVAGAVHHWGVELQDRVVLAQSLLNKLWGK